MSRHKLHSVRVVRTFSYDPEPWLEIRGEDDGEEPTQEEFEEYVTECAVEDLGCGRDSFSILPSAEREKGDQDMRAIDAMSIWEWYIENNCTHLLGDGGAYENRQCCLDEIGPALQHVWTRCEEIVEDISILDSYDWDFIPEVLEAWHKDNALFFNYVRDAEFRELWIGRFAQRKQEEHELSRRQRKKVKLPLSRMLSHFDGEPIVLEQEPDEAIAPGSRIIIPSDQVVEVEIDVSPQPMDISIHDWEQLSQFGGDGDE